MKKISLAALVLLFVCVLCGCECKHEYSEFTIQKEATCTEDGLMASVCAKCGDMKTQPIEAPGHSFGEYKETKAPSCITEGEKERTCSKCGTVETEVIGKTEHKWGEYTPNKSVTCTTAGSETRRCSVCKEVETREIEPLGHQDDGKGFCKVCGVEIPITLTMTSSEKANALKVNYLSDRSIQHDDAGGFFTLLFALKDASETRIVAPCVVDVRIEDEKGNIVYKAKKKVGTADYGTWTSALMGERLLASVQINDAEITNAESSSGTVYFSIYNDGYFLFDESTLSISYDLPTAPITIELPKLPSTVSYYGYSGTKYTSCQLNSIKYEEDGSRLNLYFSGEKTYDRDGSNGTNYIEFDWKLYDDEGYVVDSGHVMISQLTVGEKFRDEKDYVYDLSAGQHYKLVIYDRK